ncbi:MAG: molecular chaperone TorD family protein [Alphaproteobacteria bacterium]|uniref:Molecular chaperone TorD family protein n=1 Tax=Candidatus Nitrobium versatile TaxID=2884831 RepID=A0A953M2F0_9BACT|nr:molecular chaperone TorD family protein [Candidatus Nitrobium versatile]
MIDVEELMDIHQGRETIYRFLSRSYRAEVDGEFLETLKTLLPHIEEMSFHSGNESLEKGGALLGSFAHRLSHPPLGKEKGAELILELHREFASLFLVGVHTIPCSESVYRSPERLIKQEPREKVVKRYRDIGFTVSPQWREPEDHIAIELEFMASVSRFAYEAADRGDPEGLRRSLNCQREFMEEHLARWIPHFCTLLAARAGDDSFYKALSHLTDGFLEMDYEFLKASVPASGPKREEAQGD